MNRDLSFEVVQLTSPASVRAELFHVVLLFILDTVSIIQVSSSFFLCALTVVMETNDLRLFDPMFNSY